MSADSGGSAEPRVRATYAKELLAAVDRCPRKDAIRARLAAELIDDVTNAHSTTFFSGASHQRMLEAARAELDEAGYLKLMVDMTTGFRQSALMAGTVRVLLTMFGATPHTIFRHLQRLRDATVRGYGALSYTKIGEREAQFLLSGYPTLYTNDANLLLFRGTFLGILEITVPGLTGDTQVSDVDVAQGAARFRVTWA